MNFYFVRMLDSQNSCKDSTEFPNTLYPVSPKVTSYVIVVSKCKN